jgi:hypothetical protein
MKLNRNKRTPKGEEEKKKKLEVRTKKGRKTLLEIDREKEKMNRSSIMRD